MSLLRLTLAVLFFTTHLHAAAFSAGESVRVTKGEMLLFKGENFQPAAKGQEFTVLKHDTATHRVFVSYLKDDDSLVAVTLPDEVLEPAPPNAWADLVKGVAAFRDQRHDEAARLFQRAAQDANVKPLATPIGAKAEAARTGNTTGLQGVRELTSQLAKSGLPTLALPLDEGIDRLGPAPPTKLDRADLAKRVTLSQNAWMRARQSIARHRLIEAAKHLETGLAAEPGHFAMKALDARNKRDLDEAQGMLEDAEKMRRFQKGAVHAMTAIENGLKLCADHAKLRALKQEMSAQFEERTSPQITPAFLAAMKVKGPGDTLIEGRKLYTTRCAECHDLEMLDSRSMDGWSKAVAGMAGRANLKGSEQARILEYLGVVTAAVAAGVGQ
ncbi:MAG: hypothetical protein ABIZ56_09040 [Chthoniobacteraceae bacterium]